MTTQGKLLALLAALLWWGRAGVSLADDRLPVAISYFDNTSKDAALEPLKKGLAVMLITDLSVSKEIRMVERDRLNEMMTELKLQTSPYIDPSSAVSLGRGLGAAYIVTGSYIVSGEQVRIDARMIDVETSEVALTAKAEGARDDWLPIERALATQLLEGLSGSLTLVQKKKIGRKSTGSLDALSAYSSSLDALDRGDTKAAARALDAALKTDPDFQAAQSMRKRVDELAKAYDLKTYSEKVGRVSRYLAGESCECSYAKPKSELKGLSAEARLAQRFFKHGAYGPWSGPSAHMLASIIALDMAQLGQFDLANQLMQGLLSEDFMKAGKEKNIPAATCYLSQIGSYVHMMQTKFDQAMELQNRAAAVPDYSHKGMCLAGSQLIMSGLNAEKPFRKLIEEALDDPEEFAEWNDQYKVLKTIAPALRKQIDKQVANPPSCQELCPWAK